MKTLYYAGPYQSIFKISTNCEWLIKTLCLKYGRYIYEVFQSQEPYYSISVIKNYESYLIITEKGSFATTKPLFYIDKYIFENNSFNNNIFAIHGAAVEYNDKAFLFIAPTTAGKTTLTGYLTSSGFGYVAEDCILIDRITYNVIPY